jgi:hypothetical protein
MATGKALVKLLRSKPGKLMVPMVTPDDVVPIVAEKSDFIAWANEFGDKETGMYVRYEDGTWIADIDYGDA